MAWRRTAWPARSASRRSDDGPPVDGGHAFIENSALDFLAAFCAFFHARTSVKRSFELTSAAERGSSSPKGATASCQPAGALPKRLARSATKIFAFSNFRTARRFRGSETGRSWPYS